jgi:hypothetical protein
VPWLIEMATPTSQDNPASASPDDLWTLFPPLHLLRASGLAIDPRKMLLGGLALVLLATGSGVFETLPFAPRDIVNEDLHQQRNTVFGHGLALAGFFQRPVIESWLSWDAAAFSLLAPIRTVIEPGRVLFQADRSWPALALAWTQLLWALIVWSFIGGAICRMSAIQFSKRKRIGIREALKFSRRQLLGYLIAPLLPLSAVLILQGFNWLLGFLASLTPPIGNVVLGLVWIVVLFTGFLMAVLVLGLATGWPLMIAAISTEDSDGFDGFSRAFGYLVDRPWQAAAFAAFSLPIFAVSRWFLAILIGLTISLGASAVERGHHFGESAVERGDDPQTLNTYSLLDVDSHSRGPAGWIARKLEDDLLGVRDFFWPPAASPVSLPIIAWTFIPALLYVGFGPSFFWSATTVSYFLLRQSDDGTPLDSVVDWSEKTDSDQTAESESVPEAEAAPVEPASDDQS